MARTFRNVFTRYAGRLTAEGLYVGNILDMLLEQGGHLMLALSDDGIFSTQ